MDLPVTEQGNKHIVAFKDYFIKWPMVFAVPDQKTKRIMELLKKEVIPFCGVPEAVLTDRGTNLLPQLMLHVCSKLGITKLNIMVYHPEYDGMVERFNRILKSILRKHADKFKTRWDKYLSRLLWATETLPMRALVRSHHFCCLKWTAGHHLRVLCYPLVHWTLLMLQAI